MFGSNRRERAKALAIVSAIVIFYTLVVSSFFFDLGRYAPTRQSSSASQSKAENAQAEIRSFCLRERAVSGGIECVYEKWSEYHKDTRERRDLHAQEYMAFWAKWMLIASVVTAAVTLGGVFLLWKDIATTRDIGQKQTRAYIDVVDLALVTDKPKSLVKIVGTIKNTGQTPAKNLRIIEAAAIDTPPFNEDWHITPESFDSFSHVSVGHLSAGVTSPFERYLIGGDASEEVAADMKRSHVDGLDVWFFVTIIYQDVFGEQQWTMGRYMVDKDSSPVKFHACDAGNEST